MFVITYDSLVLSIFEIPNDLKQQQALLFTPKDLSEWATLAIPNGLFYIESS